jgi:uncharacterized membrane protein YeaQ/YmgE (transglycosylase-associated protein family)
MHILVMLVIGAAVGVLVRPLIPKKGRPLTQTVLSLFTIAVTMSGSVLGGFLGYSIGWYRSAMDWRGVLASILGSVAFLWMYRRAMRPLDRGQKLRRWSNFLGFDSPAEESLDLALETISGSAAKSESRRGLAAAPGSLHTRNPD